MRIYFWHLRLYDQSVNLLFDFRENRLNLFSRTSGNNCYLPSDKIKLLPDITNVFTFKLKLENTKLSDQFHPFLDI